MSARDDMDLFSPTLRDSVPRALPTGKKPWRLASQFWVAFLGGALAVTAIAYINSRRLGMPIAKQRLILLLGVVALLATIGLTYYMLGQGSGSRELSRQVRIGGRIIAVLLFLAYYQLQKGADRLYNYYTDDEEEYDSLLKPGFAAALGMGLLQLVVVGGAMLLLGRSFLGF